jgi:LysM repeat protein
MRSRRSSITARVLAPLALIAAGFAVWMVVQGGGLDGKGDTASATTTVKVKVKKPPKKYTVKKGDVLSAIAVKYGVSVQHIRDLNDDLDASALRAGEVIRLRH